MVGAREGFRESRPRGRDRVRPTRFMSLLVSLTLVAAGLVVPAAVAANRGADALLPDIGMAPLANFSVQKRAKGQLWLRFSATIVNVGVGPFQALGYNGDGVGDLEVDQQFRTTTPGVTASHPSIAKMYFGGDGHNHWHVRDLEQYVLEGHNTGRLYGEKHGFCFWDNVRYAPSLTGYPATAVYTGSNSCVTRTDGTVLMGLSIGWGDQYPATITDQYLNITGLPAGEQTVTATADSAHWPSDSTHRKNPTT